MRSGDRGDELNAEINVTPLVDVMLVLLIIFMITAPMMNTGVDIDLPQVTAQNIEDPQGPVILSIDTARALRLQGTPVTWQDLPNKLSKNEKIQKEQRIYIEADQGLPYGVVITAMAVAKNAGISKVMMLTEPKEELNLADLDKPLR